MIIKNGQFRSKFLQNSLTPKGKPHSSTLRMVNTPVLSLKWSISMFVGQYQHTNKTPVQEILHCVSAGNGIERVTHLKVFRGNTTLFGLERSKFEGCPPS